MNHNPAQGYSDSSAKQQSEYARFEGAAQGLGAARQPEVPLHMDRMERAMKEIFAGVESLETRLQQSILRPNAPQPTGNAIGQTPITAAPNTPFGSRLQEHVSGLNMVTERIQSMLQRLEA